jgi:chromosome segregation ATPase
MKTKTRVKRTPLYQDPNIDGGVSIRKYMKKIEQDISYHEDEISAIQDEIDTLEYDKESHEVEKDDLLNLHLELEWELENCRDCADGI